MQQPKFDIATYPTLDTIRLLSSLLERMCLANDQLNRAVNTRKDMGRRASSASLVGTRSTMESSTTSSATPPTRFHARALPTIDIFSYLSRILRYCPCSNECFLSLLVYFDRMSKNQLARTGRPFSIDSYNIHRLIIAGIMVSSKYFSDVYYTNTRYAKVGGLPVSELNSLELEFLVLNDFNLSVPISDLQRYGDQLIKVEYMENEMRKNIMYETPSYNPGTMRHGRSTSLGSAAALATRQNILAEDSQVDQLRDMTSCLSLDERTTTTTTTTTTTNTHQQHRSQGLAYIPKVSSNNNNLPSGATVRRMTSYGNMPPQSPHAVYNTPMSNHDSPGTFEGNESNRRRSCASQHSPAYTQGHQRNSFFSSDPWRHCSTTVNNNTNHSQHYARPRHGSMGFTTTHASNTEWQQYRQPRQSRSSASLCQYGGFRKSTPPGLDNNSNGQYMMVGGEAAATPTQPLNGTVPPASYYAYMTHPIGIPTPPPSSSPVHQKHQASSPHPSSIVYYT
ncbi:cyclin-domain-containing protein [Lichtheimia hyalospora FSU 10163]|nr:cyclin-domain-containing protein [Lichtheimia hyalospora FSU 10163]